MPTAASVEERQRHLWQQLLNSEAKFQSATQELQTLRTQQANEMKEVRHFVFFGVLDQCSKKPKRNTVFTCDSSYKGKSFQLFNWELKDDCCS